jgi:hypothetical protein
MDEKPFFEFNILEFRERDVEELKKFTKSTFDLDTILTTANELKYTRAIQSKLAAWVADPSEDFVRLVAAELLGSRRFTLVLKEQFTALTKRAFEQLIGAKINERLKGAMTMESISVTSAAKPVIPAAEPPLKDEATIASPPVDQTRSVDTSLEEIEGFHSIRAILREVIPPKRIFMRDAQSYCAVLLDDNNRKPIARLRFNNIQKLRLGLFVAGKDEAVVDLSCVDDIFNFSEQLKATASSLLSVSETAPK